MSKRKDLSDIGVKIEAQQDGSVRVVFDGEWVGDFSHEEAKMIARALNAEARSVEASEEAA